MKIYILNDSFYVRRSGLDNADILRTKLFNKHGLQTQFVTYKLDLNARFGLETVADLTPNYLNMYEELMERPTTSNPIDIKTIMLPNIAQDYIDENGRELRLTDGQTIKLQPGIDHKTLLLWTEIAVNGQTTRMKFFDPRGQQIGTEYFSPDDQQLYLREFVSTTTPTKLWTSVTATGQTTYRYRTADNQEHMFDSEAALQAFWLDELVRQNRTAGEETVFIVDRNAEWFDALQQMTEPARKISVLHNKHTIDPQQVMGPLNENYEAVLNHQELFDHFIVSSDQQAADVLARWPKATVTAIPVAVLPDQRPVNTPFVEREVGLVAIVSRIAPEKNLTEAVQAIHLAHQQNDRIHAEIWGSGNHGDDDRLQAFIDQIGATAYIKLKGYTAQPEQVWQRAQATLLTSHNEGYALSLVEALANGVPAISYDVKYGPSELIDESTGRLVPEHDYTQMAETLVRWFNTPEELARKSAAAVTSTQRFSAENIWQKWNEVLS